MDLPVKYSELTHSQKRRVREEYVRAQGGNCYYCHFPLKHPPPDSVTTKTVNPRLFPPRFFDWPIHLHHDHSTGLTLGAVHCYCNAVLWQHHGE